MGHAATATAAFQKGLSQLVRSEIIAFAVGPQTYSHNYPWPDMHVACRGVSSKQVPPQFNAVQTGRRLPVGNLDSHPASFIKQNG